MFFNKNISKFEKWYRKVDKKCNLSELESNTDSLKLVLGMGRSGTSWLANMIAHTSTPITFYNEPLHSFKYKLPFNQTDEYTACGYYEKLDEKNPLAVLYRLFSSKAFNFKKYNISKKQIRNDAVSKYILIKEVHSLLATEGLINFFDCNAVCITRNPLYVVDSLFSFTDINTVLWTYELAYFKNNKNFFKRFKFPNPDFLHRVLHEYDSSNGKRIDIIILKILTVAIINHMLKVFAEENKKTIHITYENLCLNPEKEILPVLDLFGFNVQGVLEYIKESSKEVLNENDPYSLFRVSKSQPKKDFKFLNVKEISTAISILERAGF
jgi:hypothetical protein